MVFVDSNVPMYVAGRDHPLRDPARRFLERARSGAVDICTSTEVLQEILRVFERWYCRCAKGDFDEVLRAWRERSSTLGKRVRVTDSAAVIEGVAIDLDHDGGLLIRQDSGVVVKKMAGDVVQLR